MESKLHQNAILTGCVDAYCLLCETLLKPEDAFKHIDKPIHKKTLDAAPYVDKYKDDHIRKVKSGYYCEFCNIFFTTAPKVNLHIAESNHNENKGTHHLKRLGNFVVVSNGIFISEKAWNGLIDDTCALCNVEFTDENIHKSEQNHILNLIQRKIEFVDEKAVYRMVDDESFQCLTCNLLFALNTIETHFDEDNHKKLLKKCREIRSETPGFVQENDANALQKPYSQNQKEFSKKAPEISKPTQAENKPDKKNDNKKTNKSDSKTNVNVMVKMEEAMGDVMKTNFDQNDSETDKSHTTDDEGVNDTHNFSEFPKQSGGAVVKYNPKTESPEVKSPRMDINDPAEFANEHELTYNKGNNNAFCRLCSTRLPASLKSMKEHVTGMTHHKNKASNAKKTKTNNILKKPMHMFVKQRCEVENMLFDDVVLNNGVCLTRYSYFMITKNNGRLRCQSCEVTFMNVEIGHHLDSVTHKIAMEKTPVVMNLKGEFVREVRAGLFHCGFCNIVIGAWEEVPIHFQCVEHNENKNFAGWRLQRHMSAILQHRRQQQELAFFRSFFGFPF